MSVAHTRLWVDGRRSLARARSIFDRARDIAIDTETRPQFRKGAPRNRPSLMQVACRAAPGGPIDVVLLDLLRTPVALWSAELARPFQSPHVRVVAHDFAADVRELREAFPGAAAALGRVTRCVEPNAVLQRSLPEPQRPRSLRKLALEFLDITLSKAQQTSNWAKRPLSEAQLRYASLDAAVLLPLIDRLEAAAPGSDVEGLEHTLVDGFCPGVCDLCGRESADPVGLMNHRAACAERAALPPDDFFEALYARLVAEGPLHGGVIGALPGRTCTVKQLVARNAARVEWGEGGVVQVRGWSAPASGAAAAPAAAPADSDPFFEAVCARLANGPLHGGVIGALPERNTSVRRLVEQHADKLEWRDDGKVQLVAVGGEDGAGSEEGAGEEAAGRAAKRTRRR